MINLFQIIGAIGLILMAAGVLIKKRKTQDIFYFIGGCFLLTYSISIDSIIFIILQIIFSLAAIYDFIKLQFFKK